MVYYACSYVPIEILMASGMPFDRLPVEQAMNHPELHSNLCGYCKAAFGSVEKLGKDDIFISVDSCDAMRRMTDVVSAQSSCKVFNLRLPFRRDDRAVAFFKTQIAGLVSFLSELRGCRIEDNEILTAARSFSELVGNLLRMHSQGVAYSEITKAIPHAEKGALYSSNEEAVQMTVPRIAYLGAVSDPVLIETVISDAGGLLVLNESCKGMRGFTAATSTDQPILLSIAERLLRQRIPCGRFTGDISSTTERLLQEQQVQGIVFGIPKFCDFYGFQLSSNSLPVPHTVIEIDYGDSSYGQLLTRVGAFMEALKRETASQADSRTGSFYAGIDSGSTTTNLVLLDHSGEIIFTSSRKTGVYPAKVSNNLFEEMLHTAGVSSSDISRCIATGYGRQNVSFSTSAITEITCHAKGARRLLPLVRTVIDIGGQDSKVISLEKNGMVRDFTMNDKCAAGTGRFLEVMSGIMEADLKQMSEAASNSRKSLSISSVCTVFAESEVISLISNKETIEDISAALFRAIAKRIVAMYRRVNGKGPVAFTGGVAKIPGMVEALEEVIGEDILVPPQPDIAGALGAALLAMKSEAFHAH